MDGLGLNVFSLVDSTTVCTYITDKRTDVWSQNFLIWEINFGLWAVAWAGPWEKGVWADSEQLFWVFFSIFHGQKNSFEFLFLHRSVHTEKFEGNLSVNT